jgi:hypothetical protein
MRLVVDCNAFESPSLPEFLATSAQNRAVLIDVASHEVFATGLKARTLLSPFAARGDQAVLLKPSWQIWRLSPKKDGYVQRLIDREQTSAFPGYCRLLAGRHPKALANLAMKSKESQDFGESLLTDAASLFDAMQAQIRSYHSNDLKALRSGRNLSERLCQRLTRDVAEKTRAELWQIHGDGLIPGAQEIKASLIFRLTVCGCALMVRRMAKGTNQVSARTMRNDLNDCFYAAYATLFDGLLSSDDGIVETYNLALLLLKDVFDCRRISATEATIARVP